MLVPNRSVSGPFAGPSTPPKSVSGPFRVRFVSGFELALVERCPFQVRNEYETSTSVSELVLFST